jgi:hypothetical protein
MFTQLWHILAVRIVAWSTLGIAAAIAATKSKALRAATSAAQNMFLNWVAGNLSSRHPATNTRVKLSLVAGSSLHSTWSVGVTPIGKQPMLILTFTMNFAHVSEISIHLKRGYLKGTHEVFPIPEIVVEGPYDPTGSVCIGVAPVRSKPGRKLTGKVVFVDQFNHEHTSDEITFSPNTLPPELRSNQLKKSPNCVFCDKPVEFADQAEEAQMTAHTKCIWK